MNIGKCLADLSDKEKIDLAARLTTAAMSSLSLTLDRNRYETRRDLADSSADRTYQVFGKLLRMIDSGQEPQKFPVRK